MIKKTLIFSTIFLICILLGVGIYLWDKENKKYLPTKYVDIIDNYPIKFFENPDKNSADKAGLHKYFDQIYVVTLGMRKEYVTSIFDNIDTTPNYIKALYKTDLEKLYQELYGNYKSFKNSFGEIGCYYSHRQALKSCVNSQAETCAIFEDDLINNYPKDILLGKIEQSLQELPSDWEMLFLGRCSSRVRNDPHISEMLVKPHFPWCAHAYVVNQKGAKFLLSNSKYMKKPIDDVYAKLASKNKIKTYAVDYDLFSQNDTVIPSQIQ